MATEAIETDTEVPTTRSAVIQQAIEAADREDGTAAGGAAASEAEPVVKEKAEPVEEDELLVEQGKQLMLALRDPEKAGIVIKFLAEQAGYTKNDAPTNKAEVKELKNEILDDLREGLGEEFQVIADRLAPAIEKILSKQLVKAQADIRETLRGQEQEKLEGQSAAALDTLTKSFFGADGELPAEVNAEMSKFMDRITPAATATIKEYLEDAFHFAIGKLGLTKTNPKVTQKVQQNRTDASSRLSTSRVSAAAGLHKDNSKPMTRSEAIRAAIEAVEKGD